MADIDRITAEIQQLREGLAALLVLAHEHLKAVDAAVAKLSKAKPAGTLDLSGYTSTEIAAAVGELPGRLPAWSRTRIVQKVGAGRRLAPARQNGHSRNGGGDQVRTVGDLVAGALD